MRTSVRTNSARPRGQVFMHGERLKNAPLLRHPANACFGALKRRQRMQRFPRQKYLSAMLARRASECVHQGGFARAVATEKR